MAVAVVTVVIRVAVVMVVVMVVAVVVAVIMTAVAVMALEKGFGKNLEKSFPRRKERFPLGFLIQNGARVEVIGTLINILPA